MTKKQKEFISQAKEYELGKPFIAMNLIPNGIYNGTWGKNGYNKMIIIVEDDSNYYIVNKDYQVDVINLFKACGHVWGVDVPKETSCVRICFSMQMKIDEVLSSIVPIPYYKEERK